MRTILVILFLGLPLIVFPQVDANFTFNKETKAIQLILENSHNTIEWKRWKRDFWRRYYFQTLKQGGIKIKMDKIMRRILCSRNILPNISEDDMEENADGN